jgi:hypothetical protein
MTVHKKLMEARVALQRKQLKKSGENKFAGYKYFELGDFLPQTMEIFNDLGLASVVTFDRDFAYLHITDCEDGTTIQITSPMAEASLKGAHPIQNLGAVESYQRRYLWLCAMEIVEHDIIDASEPNEPPKEQPEVKPPKKMSGGQGAWHLEITADDNTTAERWFEVLEKACDVALGMASSESDVMTIFKKNKQIFDKARDMDVIRFKAIMEKFSATKTKFKE